MKALVCTGYGLAETLQLREIEKPVPGDDEVLVKTYASSVHYNTVAFVKGQPLIARPWTGLLKPRVRIPGNDIAGCIDNTREDFSVKEQRYDLIVATAGYRSIFDYKRALNPGGTYLATGGSMAEIFTALLPGPLISMAGSKKLGSVQVTQDQKDLVFLKELIEGGKVKPLIDRSYPLSEVAEAFRYFGERRTQGKVVIKVEHGV